MRMMMFIVGVYMSVKGPASYWLGTADYEENIITDWWGGFLSLMFSKLPPPHIFH